MYRLVADDLFKDDRGHGPVDAFQHEKSPIEPGTEQVDKITVDGREIAASRERVEEESAHLRELGGGARVAVRNSPAGRRSRLRSISARPRSAIDCNNSPKKRVFIAIM